MADSTTVGDSTTLPARVSALASHHKPIALSQAGVALTEVRDLTLWQLAVWPDTLTATANQAAEALGLSSVPGFCRAESNGDKAMLRIEPCKFWVYGAQPSEIEASNGAVIDLSHSRSHVRITGAEATSVLNSYLPLDLRAQSFPVGAVASTAFHHVGVTLWRSELGYELFLPRGFAVSLWELLCEASEQYGLAVV